MVQTEIFDVVNLPIEKGLPVCEWTFDQPSKDRIDEKMNFRMFIGESSISLTIGDTVELKKLIVAERVKFGVDVDDYLRAIQVIDLQPSEMATIRSTFPSNSIGVGVIRRQKVSVFRKWMRILRQALK